jgi:hypothetical protein
MNQCVNISQGLSIDVPNHLLCFLHVQHRVQISQWLLINVHNYLLYFLHVHHHVQKVRGSRLMLYTAYITFSMRIAAYKK